MSAGAARLHAVLREEGGALAAELPAAALQADPAQADPAADAAAGPRGAGRVQELDLAVRAVHEGARLHYAASQALPIADPDLALLAGDRLYALGLGRLAAAGDLDAIAELADVIGLTAQAYAAGDPDLAAAAWELGSATIGHGPSPSAEAAKLRARDCEAGAAEALRAAARTSARRDSVS